MVKVGKVGLVNCSFTLGLVISINKMPTIVAIIRISSNLECFVQKPGVVYRQCTYFDERNIINAERSIINAKRNIISTERNIISAERNIYVPGVTFMFRVEHLCSEWNVISAERNIISVEPNLQCSDLDL